MSVPLPILSNPCITAASSTSIYLMGMPGALEGRLQMFTVSLDSLDKPIAVQVGKEQVANTWVANSQLACFSYGDIGSSQHNTVLLLQIAGARTDVANFRSSGVFDNPTLISDFSLKSTRLLAQVGLYSTFSWLIGSTASLDSSWRGMRFLSTNITAFISDIQTTPTPTKSPFLVVGAFKPSINTPTQGYSIIFDSPTSGFMYGATGAGDATDPIILSAPIALDMKGVSLSPKAIPVTMESHAYILDEAEDSSTKIYILSPGYSNKLGYFPIKGKTPAFHHIQSATSANNMIVIYSVSNTSAPAPFINVFNTADSSWSGPELVGLGSSSTLPPFITTTKSPQEPTDESNNKNRSLTAPVVGGLIALAIILFALYWTVRYRRRHQKDKDGASMNEFSSQKLELDQQKQLDPTMQEDAATQRQVHPESHLPNLSLVSVNSLPNAYGHTLSFHKGDFLSQPQPPFNPYYLKQDDPLV